MNGEILLGFSLLGAYFAIGCFTAGGMFGNSHSAPDMDHVVVAVLFWPIILVLYIGIGVFAAGAWVVRRFGL